MVDPDIHVWLMTDNFSFFLCTLITLIYEMIIFFADLPLFGYCPAQDELYLVVCEKCEQVIKPQALKTHLGKSEVLHFRFLFGE